MSTLSSRKALLGLAAVALAQTAALAYMVIDRIQLLRTGREIVLSIVPVDPRDFFRGEYVRLDYPAAQVALVPADGVPLKRNEMVYVTLERSAQGDDWRPIAVSRTLKREDNPDRILLKARSLWDAALYDRWRGAAVRYGIERYFVRQGDGPKLEALARDRKMAVLVAVDNAGTAAIKGLIIDGKLQYEEPLL
jgi:uncharacterized membrane-anchored protein